MKILPTLAALLSGLILPIALRGAPTLIVTEINSNQSASGAEDFWELANAGDEPIDLSGWKWDDNSRDVLEAVTFPEGTVLGAGEVLIVTQMGADAFRTWWGLNPSVTVVTLDGPGLGQNDGVALFDEAGVEQFFFSYAAGALTLPDGSASAGGHAGASTGGSATVSAVLDPAFGVEVPRYGAAAVGLHGAFASALDAADIGSPGVSGLSGTNAPGIQLSLAVTPASISESAGAGAATGTVTRDGETTSALEVDLSSSDTGEATVPATVVIPVGQSSATFPIDAVDDTFPDGTVVISLTALAADATVAVAELSVADDGDVLTERFLVTEILSNQSDGAPADAEDFWELTNVGEEAVDLSGYSWHDGGRSAASAAAWALPEGTVIAAGESVIFTEADPVVFRSWWGLPESVQVFQSAGAPGLGQNDGVSFFDAGGNELLYQGYGAGQFTLEDGTASLGGHAGLSAGGSAASQSMVWVPASGSDAPRYTFADGTRLGTRQSVIGSDLGSPGRTEAVVSSNPLVSASSDGVEEGDAGVRALTFDVTRDTVDTAFTVDYAVTGGTAVAGQDFEAEASGTLVFSVNGALVETVSISVNGDTLIEGDETVVLTLSNLVNTTGATELGAAVVAGMIRNDDTVENPYPATGAVSGAVLASIELGGSEIPAYDPGSRRAFASSGDGVQVVDLRNPAHPVRLPSIDMLALGFASNNLSSIAVHDGLLAVGIINEPKTEPGDLAFLDAATGALLGRIKVGPNPDAVVFSPDGTKILVANEGELVGQVADDAAPGSVTVVDLSISSEEWSNWTAGFSAFDSAAADLREAGVRLFEGGIPSLDFEPEYIAVAPDGSRAMVTLQEANAVAILDLVAREFTEIVALGEKDYRELLADFSDRDGPEGARLIAPTAGNPVFGLYMPDAVAAYTVGGETYYVTANEGDDRDDFVVPEETIRLGDEAYLLDPATFPNGELLKENRALGRLTVSNAPGLRGDTDGDGDIDRILAYGARSFSILDSSGNLVFDSGDMLELIVAGDYPANVDDGRSDNKGPEPEGVTVAQLGGRLYAFVGLERVHLVLIFDVTDPLNVTYAGGLSNPGDSEPEGIVVVKASDSPTGKPLAIVSSEDSNTLTVYELAFTEALPWNRVDNDPEEWNSFAWFGEYRHVGSDYLRHRELGWLYTRWADDPENLLFYSQTLNGWIWSSASVFPTVFDYDRGEWIYFVDVGFNGTQFSLVYRYSTASWLPLAAWVGME